MCENLLRPSLCIRQLIAFGLKIKLRSKKANGVIKVILTFVFFFFCLFAFGEERWQKLAEPKSLNPEAVIEEWPRFNGQNNDAKSKEYPILLEWPSNGPSLIWTLSKGAGYASPAIFGKQLVLFHRMEGREIAECRDAQTGRGLWEYSYPVDYKDRYGYSAGPRASPVIFDGRVYLHGVTAWLTCLDLKTGKLLWKRDLRKEYQVPHYFFGKGSNPIVCDDGVILNVGGGNRQCIVNFDRKTGETIWVLKDDWGASYSSPIFATIHEQFVGLAMTGGESRPATGGLLIFDPKTGKKLARFPWRSKRYESATACPPVALGENYIFLSECYDKGSVLLHIKENFSTEVVWENPSLGIHWMTPVERNGILYGVSGRHQQGAEAFGLDWKKGHILWKDRITWKQRINGRDLNLQLFRGSWLLVGNRFLCLSELGSLLNVRFSPDGWGIEQCSQLFFAPETWTLPALSKGLLYVMQNETDRMSGETSRLLCYDLRGS